MNVGFTSTGLAKIGLSRETLATFSPEFQQGMAKGARPLALGDVGESAPANWDWGLLERPVDALVLVYAKTKEACAARAAELEAAIEAAHGSVLHSRSAEMLAKDRREHFGFVDGLSQPQVRGRDPKVPDEESIAAGEFVFGYPNAYVDWPDAPTLRGVDAAALEGSKDDAMRACLGAGGLGANGTYLVARDLRQDVAAFNRFVADQAVKVHPNEPPAKANRRFEAECVGRWKNGDPLSTPRTSSPRSDLTFNDDPSGVKCPIMAHIRRANPRDSLTLSPEESRVIADRHRIVRRGRNFGAFIEEGSVVDDDPKREKRGLFFMCVNTNIARQFEFIQQTWLQSTKFGGLRTDRDPLLGRGPDEDTSLMTATIATAPLRARVPVTPFVTVRGGGYFFMPSKRALKVLAWIAGRAHPAQPGSLDHAG